MGSLHTCAMTVWLIVLQFSWSAENLTVSEDAGMTTIPISFTGNAGQYQVIVNWAIGEGSADVEDFLNITDQVVLSNSVRSQNISVSIIQDDISELDETFTLSLESVSLFDTSNLVTVNLTEGDRDRLLFTIRETTVTIQDDDGNLHNNTLYQSHTHTHTHTPM